MVTNDRPTASDLRLAQAFLVEKSPKGSIVHNAEIDVESYVDIFERLTLYKESPTKKRYFHWLMSYIHPHQLLCDCIRGSVAKKI